MRYLVFNFEGAAIGSADTAQHASDIACNRLAANAGEAFAYYHDSAADRAYPFTRFEAAPMGYVGTQYRSEAQCIAGNDSVTATGLEFNPRTVRLDEWALTYLAPTSVPRVYARTGSVFRGMRDETKARAYADQVAEFFAMQGCPAPVYVVRGPTSTTVAPFEVVAACCGHSVLYRVAACSR